MMLERRLPAIVTTDVYGHKLDDTAKQVGQEGIDARDCFVANLARYTHSVTEELTSHVSQTFSFPEQCCHTELTTLVVYSDGRVYEGDWVNGSRHGLGKYTWANEDVYEGLG